MIRSCSLKPWQICDPASVEQIISLHFFSSFELGGITKHLMAGPAGNIEGLGETKLTVSFGASHEVLITIMLGLQCVQRAR